MECPKNLIRTQIGAWNSFVAVVQGFLGNHKAKKKYSMWNHGAKLDAHLDRFKDNMGVYSEEQGKRFHQNILDFEACYEDAHNGNMVGDYIWILNVKTIRSISVKQGKLLTFKLAYAV